MKSILVTYVSLTGSTKAAAEEFVRVLLEKGFQAEIKKIADVTDSSLTAYDGICVGAPINGMMWHSEASAFLERNKAVLSEKKTALFCLTYMYGKGRKLWDRAIEKSMRTRAESIGALRTEIFPGKVESPLPTLMRIIFGIPKDCPNDRTDKALVRERALAVAELLG